MNKFFLKSNESDFQKLIQQMKTIHKNVLYLTYQVDFIRKKVMSLSVDKDLQKTVDDFYRHDGSVEEQIGEDLQ